MNDFDSKQKTTHTRTDDENCERTKKKNLLTVWTRYGKKNENLSTKWELDVWLCFFMDSKFSRAAIWKRKTIFLPNPKNGCNI